MNFNKLFIVVLLGLFCHLVMSAPSLNNNPKMSNNLVIAVDDDVLSDEMPRTSNHSDPLLPGTDDSNSTKLEISGTSNMSTPLTTNQSSTVNSMQPISLNSTNITSVFNFTLLRRNNSSGVDLLNMLTDFFTGMFDAHLNNITIHRMSLSPASTFAIRPPFPSSMQNRHHSSINPSLFHFSSPSLRLFWNRFLRGF